MAQVAELLPIPGLNVVVSSFASMMDTYQHVQRNRYACIRLVERCADILLQVRDAVAGGGNVEDLQAPLKKLEEAFQSVHVFVNAQLKNPYLKQYLGRDTLPQIAACDTMLSDALAMFSLSIQIRTLKQIQQFEALRQKNTDELLQLVNLNTSDMTTVAEISDEDSSSSNADSYHTAVRKGTDEGEDFLCSDYITELESAFLFRDLLVHDFHSSLRLPLWTPGHVELGAVGMLCRETGRFLTLFNAFDPPVTVRGCASGMSSLSDYGSIPTGSSSRATAVSFGCILDQLADGADGVVRSYTFRIGRGAPAAYLWTENIKHNFMKSLDTPKKWLQCHIKAIVDLFETSHGISKEDVILVVGTLSAQKYAMLVKHSGPDIRGRFQVFENPQPGEEWGGFDLSCPWQAEEGPDYEEEGTLAGGDRKWAKKVSVIDVHDAEVDTLLLARLSFKLGEESPTTL